MSRKISENGGGPKQPATTALVDGVEIVDDVFEQPGVETLEGTVGMLVQGRSVQGHYIEMEPGLYLGEHAHETESIIATLRGEWVLCSRGERHHMTPGSLFWFGPDVPTGYEVPDSFSESAYILVFKGEKTDDSTAEFVDYLENEVAPMLEAEREDGTPFAFDELPDDHPAVEFARSL